MDNYKTTLEIQTRFRDTDAMGHINNSVYLSFLELARMEYVKRVFGVTHFRDVDFILARAEVDYRSPSFAGEVLVVGIRLTRLGGASFDMDYRIEERSQGRLVAQAKTVQVSYDYQLGKVKRLSEDFVEKVKKYDDIA